MTQQNIRKALRPKSSVKWMCLKWTTSKTGTKLAFPLIVSVLFAASPAKALYTEVGVSYARDKKTFDANNYTDTESFTGQLSFYFWDRVALELSYTDATGLMQQKAGATDPSRSVLQKTQVMGSDLILTFADRKAFLQPFIKGGVAQITRSQEIQIEGFGTQKLEPETATVPSYGAGIKMAITDYLKLTLSYNIWKTPFNGGTDDTSLRAGVSWIF